MGFTLINETLFSYKKSSVSKLAEKIASFSPSAWGLSETRLLSEIFPVTEGLYVIKPTTNKNTITRGRIINNFLFPSIFICMAFVSNLKTRPHQNTTGKAAHFEAPI